MGPLPLTPSPVIDPVAPPQTLVLVVGVAVSVGTELTVIVIHAELVQLFPLVPLTVYVVVPGGVTLMELPLAEVLQV